MLKIVVFDGGCGGEVVAEYLEAELNVVEVSHVVDSSHASYETKTPQEVCALAEQYLAPYIGEVDLIVLGGYTVSLALDYLRNKFSHQKFVGLGVNYHRILKAATYPIRVTVIMNENLLQSPLCDELRDGLPFSTLAIPDCSGWSVLADRQELSADTMRADLSPYFVLQTPRKTTPPKRPPENCTLLETILQEKYQKPPDQISPTSHEVSLGPSELPARPLISSDVVLILNTCLWNVRKEIESIFGYKVRVLDFRQKLLHDTCASLNLLGLDGEASK